MNTTTNTTTAPGTKTPGKRRPKRRDHIYHQPDADAAADMGVQVRAFCGVWVWPPKRGTSELISEVGFDPEQCGNCVRIWRAGINRSMRRSMR